MFIARQKELGQLKDLQQSDHFEFLIMYGRRRVGKTTLLKEFAKTCKVIFFSAQEKNDYLNLVDFSKLILSYFNLSKLSPFDNWEDAFSFLKDRCSQEKVTLIIDEFPFLVKENPSLKSILQHKIDHGLKDTNLFLILCGSSISFMENEVMGYQSPLYGRSTSKLELEPLDYLDSSAFFENYSAEDKCLIYGILGGIPSYLEKFDRKLSIKKNLKQKLLTEGAFLKDEPQTLLRMELRDLNTYNGILEAVALGATKLNEIATKIHAETSKTSKYIDTLKNLRILKRETPCGEETVSRKTIYSFTDNFFAFWYQFIFSNQNYFSLLNPAEAVDEIFEGNALSTYMGHIFEQICYEFLLRKAKHKELAFVPFYMGRWWGANPVRKCQDDIDILLKDKTGSQIIICECKYKNEHFSKEDYQTMLSRKAVFSNDCDISYIAFSKSGFSSYVKQNALKDRVTLFELEDLFNS